FAVGDAIDLAGLPFGPGSTATYSGTTLTVTGSGGVTQMLTVLTTVPVGVQVGFAVADDGHGGHLVTESSSLFPSVVSSGQTVAISAGEVGVGITVLSGGTLIAVNGGTSSATQVTGSGGLVSSGGVAALEVVSSGGTALATSVSGGG